MPKYIGFIALALGLGACGPSEREVGVLILMSLLPMVIVGIALQVAYRVVWIRAVERETPEPFNYRPTTALVAASIAVFIIPIVVGPSDEVLIATYFGGATYLTYLLICMRILVRRQRLYARASWIPWLMFAPLAIGLTVWGSATSDADLSLAYYLLPGYAGLVPAAIILVLTIEVVIRHRIALARERAQEPVFPEARAL